MIKVIQRKQITCYRKRLITAEKREQNCFCQGSGKNFGQSYVQCSYKVLVGNCESGGDP